MFPGKGASIKSCIAKRMEVDRILLLVSGVLIATSGFGLWTMRG